MLGLPPTARAQECRQPPSRNELWQKVLDRSPVGVPILDAHGHVGAATIWPMLQQESPEQISAGLKAMDRAGIETIIVSEMEALYGDPVAGNPNLGRKAAVADGRVLGYFAFNPFYADKLIPMLDDCFSRGFFVGIKFLCGYWGVKLTDPPWSPRWNSQTAGGCRSLCTPGTARPTRPRCSRRSSRDFRMRPSSSAIPAAATSAGARRSSRAGPPQRLPRMVRQLLLVDPVGNDHRRGRP